MSDRRRSGAATPTAVPSWFLRTAAVSLIACGSLVPSPGQACFCAPESFERDALRSEVVAIGLFRSVTIGPVRSTFVFVVEDGVRGIGAGETLEISVETSLGDTCRVRADDLEAMSRGSWFVAFLTPAHTHHAMNVCSRLAQADDPRVLRVVAALRGPVAVSQHGSSCASCMAGVRPDAVASPSVWGLAVLACLLVWRCRRPSTLAARAGRLSTRCSRSELK